LKRASEVDRGVEVDPRRNQLRADNRATSNERQMVEDPQKGANEEKTWRGPTGKIHAAGRLSNGFVCGFELKEPTN